MARLATSSAAGRRRQRGVLLPVLGFAVVCLIFARSNSRTESGAPQTGSAAAADGAAVATAGGDGDGADGYTTTKQQEQPREIKPIPPIWDRQQLIQLLQNESLTTGAELGVLFGHYAKDVLSNWTKCEKYYLVDLWGVQENYEDTANMANAGTQDARFKEAQERLAPWKDKTVFLRMLTIEAAKRVPDRSLDFVYIDARHDYCGVTEDLEGWWPKMRPGGVFAGHDYLEAGHGLLVGTNQDWSKCMNGTINMGAVKGAVNEFAAARNLTVTVTGEGGWATWIMRAT